MILYNIFRISNNIVHHIQNFFLHPLFSNPQTVINYYHSFFIYIFNSFQHLHTHSLAFSAHFLVIIEKNACSIPISTAPTLTPVKFVEHRNSKRFFYFILFIYLFFSIFNLGSISTAYRSRVAHPSFFFVLSLRAANRAYRFQV